MPTIDIRHERVDVRLKRAIETGSMPKELLIVGPAGTGKTYSILRVIHTIARDNPGLRILFLRATRVSLTESVLVTYEQEILPADDCMEIAAGASRPFRHSYHYPNGTDIVVGGLDRNPTRILSTAWDIVFSNECVELQQEVWETICSRMGRPGRDRRFGWMIGDTNPSYPEHWIKKRADAGGIKLWDTTHEANPVMHDGQGWTAVGKEYLASLDKLTGPRRKRLRDGIWAQGEGVWFESFEAAEGGKHVNNAAEYVYGLPVHLAIDCGVSQHTGAVFFQTRQIGHERFKVNVFADFYSVGKFSAAVAAELKKVSDNLPHRGVLDTIRLDPAASARTGVGPAAYGEFEKVFGNRPMSRWPSHQVVDGLDQIEILLDDGCLVIHPRCKHLISAFSNYRRAERNGRIINYPADPQNPHEDMMDALRGGIRDRFPEGRTPAPKLISVHAGRI